MGHLRARHTYTVGFLPSRSIPAASSSSSSSALFLVHIIIIIIISKPSRIVFIYRFLSLVSILISPFLSDTDRFNRPHSLVTPPPQSSLRNIIPLLLPPLLPEFTRKAFNSCIRTDLTASAPAIEDRSADQLVFLVSCSWLSHRIDLC